MGLLVRSQSYFPQGGHLLPQPLLSFVFAPREKQRQTLLWVQIELQNYQQKIKKNDSAVKGDLSSTHTHLMVTVSSYFTRYGWWIWMLGLDTRKYSSYSCLQKEASQEMEPWTFAFIQSSQGPWYLFSSPINPLLVWPNTDGLKWHGPPKSVLGSTINRVRFA